LLLAGKFIRSISHLVFFVLITQLISICVNAQSYTPHSADDTFYDFCESYTDAEQRNNYSVASEHVEHKHVKRLSNIWTPRLSPSGDATLAARELIKYYSNYKFAPSGYHPNWTCLGPTGRALNSSDNGRMHRIEFDPQYDGVTNKTIYASSGFGGLWRSADNGEYWTQVNTDLQLPTTSVGDIAIHPDNSNIIFITTGLCDEGIVIYEANTGKINPIFTAGIFRSTDFGNTWQNISLSILQDFSTGGAIRRMLINNDNPDQIFIASSNGIYRTDDAQSAEPNWINLFQGINSVDNELYGLEFKPDDASTIFASGKDIYQTIDGGNNWMSITGPNSGLDLNNLPDTFQVGRINIATTIANPDLLYAYLVGDEYYYNSSANMHLKRKRAYIYCYDDQIDLWDIKHSLTETRNDGSLDTNKILSWDRIALVASPVNAQEVYFGTTVVWGTTDIDNEPFAFKHDYFDTGTHNDVHGLELDPVSPATRLIVAHDGGISAKNLSIPGTDGWEYLYDGLQVTTIWAFDQAEYAYEWIGIGNQDCGTMFLGANEDGYAWDKKYGDDGYGIQNLKVYPEYFFIIPSKERYNYLTNTGESEEAFSPWDYSTNTTSAFIKAFHIKQHPQKDVIYKGFTEIYERLFKIPVIGQDLWQVESDIGKIADIQSQWKRQIIDFEFAASNPDYIYIVTLGVYNGYVEPWELHSHLLMSNTGMNEGNYWDEDHFVELEFPGNGFDPFPVITALEVHPLDPQKIWITFSGFVQGYKVWSFNGTQWANVDPNNSLNNLPVNDIVYQQGTNERLYIATDAGIYVKDASMPNWEKYGDFPNVRAVELKINYCANKLRVATFGRGLWEGDLLPSKGYDNERIIADHIIWDDKHAVAKNIRIIAAGKLSVTGNLSMPNMGNIIVEPGGELEIDGGKIFNNCGNMWWGIQVWGNPVQSQYTSGAQGKVTIKNGGIIENAVTAVALGKSDGMNYTAGFEGGIIQASGARFVNNQTAVKFFPYRNYNPANPGFEIDNLSYFYDAEFLTDAPLADDSHPGEFVSLNGVSGIGFQGCLFSNTRDFKDALVKERGSGIYSRDANFTITQYCPDGYPCTAPQNSEFRSLNYGVKAYNTISTKTFTIDQTDFINNLTGIYLKGVDYPGILFSNFELRNVFEASEDISCGLFLDNCTGFIVEENNFYNNISYDPNGEIRSIGITIDNSANDVNSIYRNSFEKLHIGILAQNNNRGNTEMSGLKIKCNRFSGNNGDIAVTAEEPSPQSGISFYQGAFIPGDLTAPAGNLFSHKENNNQYSDLINTIDQAHIIYFHNQSSATETRAPEYYTDWSVTACECPLLYSFEEACPSNYSNGSGITLPTETAYTETAMKLRMQTMENLRDSTEHVLSLWIDGGNTDPLEFEVSMASTPEALAIYDELMSVSPYLSDQVLNASIDREDVLVDAMIRDILVANPQVAKDENLLQRLDQRSPPLPEYMMAEVMEGENLVTSREKLEAEIAWYEQERVMGLNRLINLYIMDTTNPGAPDTLQNLLSNYGQLRHQYWSVREYLGRGEIVAATQKLSDLPNQFTMSTEELTDHQNFSDIFNMVTGLMLLGEPLDSLDLPSRLQLYQFAEGINEPAIMAQNILQYIDTTQFPEKYILPPESLTWREYDPQKPANILALDENKSFNVYPNPCRDYFILAYNFETLPAEAQIVVSDPAGRIFDEIEIYDLQNQQIIRTSQYSSGIYIFSLIVDEEEVKSRKIAIVK